MNGGVGRAAPMLRNLSLSIYIYLTLCLWKASSWRTRGQQPRVRLAVEVAEEPEMVAIKHKRRRHIVIAGGPVHRELRSATGDVEAMRPGIANPRRCIEGRLVKIRMALRALQFC